MTRALPALLSLLAPGVGQLMRGRIARGAVLASLAVIAPFALPLLGVWALVAWIALRVIAGIDAALGPQPPAGHALATSLTGGAQGLAAFVWLRLFALESFVERSAAMEPTLRGGDHLFVSKLAYRLGAIARGDVITFHDPCGRDVTFVSRVIALAGDTVEVRCARLYVDGARVHDEPAGSYAYEETGEGVRGEQRRASRWHEQLGDARFDILGPEERPSLESRLAADPSGDYLEYADVQDFPPIDGHVVPAPQCEGPSPSAFERTIDRPAQPCDPQLDYVVPPGTVFVVSDNRDNAVDSRRFGPVPVDDLIGRLWMVWWHQR